MKTDKPIQRICFLFILLLLPTHVFGSFKLTDRESYYLVDTGGDLVFKVDKNNGDITSIVYDDEEYQSARRGSHLISGLGSEGTTVSAEMIDREYIKITIQTDESNGVVSSLTHYLIVRKKEDTIYMATYATAEPRVGELRWITRLQSEKIPDGPAPSDLRNSEGPIESKDVFGMADGTSRSKYYGDRITHGKDRAMDLTYCGASGRGIGVWMVYGNRESSSGGPFYRDIQNQCGSDQEIYNYMNSGHAQTEDWRVNVLHGPYALVFSDGDPPSLPIDFSWIEKAGLDLKGWVPESGRGIVKGSVEGIPDGYEKVVGFSNADAQYWTVAGDDGSYTSPLMKPGTYTVTLYRQELGVATNSVTVKARSTEKLDLEAPADPEFLWRIGDPDGTPAGFMNADKVITMHPSDVRMKSWDIGPFVIGTSNPGTDFPCYQWQKKVGTIDIQFELAKKQIVDCDLRIGISAPISGARPAVQINEHDLRTPTGTAKIGRTLTIGTYRGNTYEFSYGLKSSDLVAGNNTLSITPASGTKAEGFLSPGYSIDYIELRNPEPDRPPEPSGLTATANEDTIKLEWIPVPSASRYILERSTSETGPYSVLTSNLGPARYTDTTAEKRTTYYYRVKAVNAKGEGRKSAQTSASL